MREIKEDVYGIIYKATNKVNGKSYIGQTTKSLQIRKAAHIRDHTNKTYSNLAFYRALNKHNPDSFEWDVIDYAATEEELNEKEIYWIAHYKSNKGKGYNMTAGGQGVKNYKVTEEGIQRRKDVLRRMWANGHAAKVQKGEEVHNAIFTNIQVKEIVQHLIKRDLNENELAKKYGVEKRNIYAIKNRKSYKYLISDEDVLKMNQRRKGDNKKTKEITKKEVLQMKDLLLYTKIPSIEIYSMYNITHGQFNTILYKSEWSNLFTEEERKTTRNRRGRRELTINEVIAIKEMLQEELYTHEEVGMIFDVKLGQIKKITNGERWGNVLIDLPIEDIEDYEWKFIDWKPQKPNYKY